MNHLSQIKLVRLTNLQQLHRVFFLTVDNQIYCGMNLAHAENYPLLFAKNIFGKMLNIIPLKDCVVIKYLALNNSAQDLLIHTALDNGEISFPFPIYPKSATKVSALSNYWETIAVEKLDADEEILRNAVIVNLKHYIDPSKQYTVYDPACSSGTFLSQLVNSYSNLTPIASDISPKMVSLASAKLPYVFISDAKLAIHQLDTKIDILILRFLNYEVVKDDVALEILEQLVKIIRDDGIIVIFGYTPILNVVPSFLVSNGWRMINSVFAIPEQNALVQGYIFSKG